MKTPIWKLIVGGLMIYIGLVGTLSGILSLYGTLFDGKQVQIANNDERNGQSTDYREEANDPLRDISENPIWEIVVTVAYLLIRVLYLIGGIALIKKVDGKRIFYWAIFPSILWAIAETIFIIIGNPQFRLLAFLPLGLIRDLVFLGIVVVGSRHPHTPSPSKPTSSSSGSHLQIRVITGWIVAVCVGLFPFWLVGLPGNQSNDHANGWMIGLQILMGFPAIWLTIYIAYRLLKKFLRSSLHEFLEKGESIGFQLLFALGVFRFCQALFPIFR